jgi:hypothetical protein
MATQANQSLRSSVEHRSLDIPKASTPKWKAEQIPQEIILKETKGVGPTPTLPPG